MAVWQIKTIYKTGNVEKSKMLTHLYMSQTGKEPAIGSGKRNASNCRQKWFSRILLIIKFH